MTKRVRTRIFHALVTGLVLGALSVLALRFVLIKNTAVHYHANFALYVNGTRDEFKSFTFYEEIASCSSDQVDNPKIRVHMHDQINNVVHVHDNGATWSAFFANLGYTLGDNLIKTDNGVFIDGQDGKKLTFELNGQKVKDLANRPIKSEDVALISYGSDSDEVLNTQYQSINRDAHEFNQKQDPSSCKGGHPLTLSERLKKTLDLTK